MAITAITAVGSIATKSVAATNVITLTVAVAAGDAIILSLGYQFGSSFTMTITDSVGNTYSGGNGGGSGGTAGSGTYFCNSIAAMAVGATITVAITGGTFSTLVGVVTKVPGGDALSFTNLAGANTTSGLSSTAVNVGDAIYCSAILAGPTADTFTQDTANTVGGSWATLLRAGTNAGGATSNTTIDNAGKVLTAAGNITWQPTYGTVRTIAAGMNRIRPLISAPHPILQRRAALQRAAGF